MRQIMIPLLVYPLAVDISLLCLLLSSRVKVGMSFSHSQVTTEAAVTRATAGGLILVLSERRHTGHLAC